MPDDRWPADALLTMTQAAQAVGVSKQLVNDWRRRGLLHQHDGRYRLGDVIEIEYRTRTSPLSRRQPCPAT